MQQQVAEALSAAQQQLSPLTHQLQQIVQQSSTSYDMLVATGHGCSCAGAAGQQQQRQLAEVRQALADIQHHVLSIKPAWDILHTDMHRVWEFLHSDTVVRKQQHQAPADLGQLEGMLASLQLGQPACCVPPPVVVLQQHLAAFKQLVAGAQQRQQLVLDLVRCMPPCGCSNGKQPVLEQLDAMLGGLSLL
jgi:hypothetical protein